MRWEDYTGSSRWFGLPNESLKVEEEGIKRVRDKMEKKKRRLTEWKGRDSIHVAFFNNVRQGPLIRKCKQFLEVGMTFSWRVKNANLSCKNSRSQILLTIADSWNGDLSYSWVAQLSTPWFLPGEINFRLLNTEQ